MKGIRCQRLDEGLYTEHMLRSLASNIKKHGSGDGTRRYISKKLWEYITEFHLAKNTDHKSKLVGQSGSLYSAASDNALARP